MFDSWTIFVQKIDACVYVYVCCVCVRMYVCVCVHPLGYK